jgi:hypothetical protein
MLINLLILVKFGGINIYHLYGRKTSSSSSKTDINPKPPLQESKNGGKKIIQRHYMQLMTGRNFMIILPRPTQ